MKTKTNSVLAVYGALLAVCILIVPLMSCNFFGLPDYELTVTVRDGVQGKPENGQHAYKDLTEVEYKYSPVNPLCTVEVIYEGSQQSAAGKFTMYSNVALEARLVDIRDIWKVTFAYNDSKTPNIAFNITFSGSSVLSGTFSDARGYNGTWDASNNKIKIKYTDWKDYVLEGSSIFTLSGTWKGESKSGTWSAVRQ